MMTTIEWTEKTWNPVAGCSVTSPGCKNCYAMKTAHRLGQIGATAPKYAGLTKVVNGRPVWTGVIGEGSDAEWEQPLRRRKPTVWFVNSMGDLFHPKVTDAQIDRVFAIMARCPQHRFQILTKYPARMRDYVSGAEARIFAATRPDQPDALARHGRAPWWPLPHVWLGVSVEDQRRADERIPILLDTPAAVRFISAEPLLGPVHLSLLSTGYGDFPAARVVGDTVDALTGERVVGRSGGYERVDDWPGLDWVIVGGESGPGARPMHPDWARSLRDQCAAADVPFFFKQWGAFQPIDPVDRSGNAPESARRSARATVLDPAHACGHVRFHDGTVLAARPKSRDPKTLDGVTHHAMPDTAPPPSIQETDL